MPLAEVGKSYHNDYLDYGLSERNVQTDVLVALLHLL